MFLLRRKALTCLNSLSAPLKERKNFALQRPRAFVATQYAASLKTFLPVGKINTAIETPRLLKLERTELCSGMNNTLGCYVHEHSLQPSLDSSCGNCIKNSLHLYRLQLITKVFQNLKQRQIPKGVIGETPFRDSLPLGGRN